MKAHQEIAVYAGRGSSHSWTWLADLFETHRLFSARFLGTDGLGEALERRPSAVIVSGGDGVMIAEAFTRSTFGALESFISEGGLYVGICAGAYLPLPSSLEPFTRFNISSTRIENISEKPLGNSVSPREAVGYGPTCSIVHPVRGELVLAGGTSRFNAPLYGGPVFKDPNRDSTLLTYAGFTESTEFQTDPDLAGRMMLGKPAAIKCMHGDGELVLLGPHLEHPKYRTANNAFLRILHLEPKETRKAFEKSRKGMGAYLAKVVADLKVTVLGLEGRSFLVGSKLWDGSRLLQLIDAIEAHAGYLDERTANTVAQSLSSLREELLSCRDGSGLDSDAGPDLLVEAARVCTDSHFQKLDKSR